MGALRDFWLGLVRMEHQLERALGLHPANDTTSSATSSPSSPSSTGPAVELVPRAGSPASAARIRRTAELLSRYWPELSGESGPMPGQALELAIAQSGLETVYGGGWSDKTSKGQGDMRGSNNLGARQCGAHDTAPGAGPWHCVDYGDSRPPTDAERAKGQTDNVAIPAKFRFFDAGEGRSAEENGAFYFLRDLLKTWPVKAELLSGDAGRYAHRLGPDKANGGLYYFGGFGATMAEREGSYVKALASRLPEVAAALGHDKVAVRVPALSEGKFYRPTSDVRVAGVDLSEWFGELGRAMVRGEHDLECWLGLRSGEACGVHEAHDAHAREAGGTSPLAAVLDASTRAPASRGSEPMKDDRRARALQIVSEVVPSRYGDERFKKLAPGFRVEGTGSGVRMFEGATELPASFTTCGYLPGYLGSRLGLAKNLSSYGTEGLRTNARAWNAWITPGEGHTPRPGDAYAIEGAGGGIVHVGIFLAKNPDGSWHTADAGQGTKEAQEARFVDRPYDATAKTLGGPLGPRPLAGWVDLDAVPLAADARIAGADRDRETPGAILAAVLFGELGAHDVGPDRRIAGTDRDAPGVDLLAGALFGELGADPRIGGACDAIASATTSHAHRCTACAEVWQHEHCTIAHDDSWTGEAGREKHACPACRRLPANEWDPQWRHVPQVHDPRIGAASSSVPPAGLDPIAWWPIDVAGYHIQTTREPISVAGQRRPLSFAQLIAIGRANRAIPITIAVSDARWAQAQDRRTVDPLTDPRGAVYNDPAQIAAFAARLGAIGNVLRDGAWKEMILTSTLKQSGPGSMIFYGFRRPDGTTIQHGLSSDHFKEWIEYDELGTLMQRDAIGPDGRPVDLLDVLARGGSPLMAGKLPPFLVADLGGLASAGNA